MSGIRSYNEDNSMCFSRSFSTLKPLHLSVFSLLSQHLQPLPELFAPFGLHTPLVQCCKSLAEGELRSLPPSHIPWCLLLHPGFVHLQENRGSMQWWEEPAGCGALLSHFCWEGFGDRKALMFHQAECEGQGCADVGWCPPKEGKSHLWSRC